MKVGKMPNKTRATRKPRTTQAAVVVPAPIKTASPDSEAMASSGASDAGTADRLTLPADCSARRAEELKAQLLRAVAAPREVLVAVEAVERIDTVCLQLLCAFARDRARQQYPTRWRGTSAPFGEAVRSLGLAATLGAESTFAAAAA